MDWSSIINQLIDILLPILATAVTAIFSYIGVKIKTIIQEKADTDAKKAVVESTVKYVEQVFKDLSGEAKLDKALKTASEWLAEKGISVSDVELRVLIEAAVNGLEKAKKEEIKEDIKVIEETK